jgi:hypothetical protein
MTTGADLDQAERVAAAPAGSSELPPLTLADELARVAPGWDLAQLCRWPPDVFAFTGSALADSGAYRCVVSPPADMTWPPRRPGAEWQTEFRELAATWSAWAAAGATDPTAAPEPVRRLQATLEATAEVALDQLDRPEHWAGLASLLELHALADEASAGAGLRAETVFQRAALAQLSSHGTLGRLPKDRVRVLPKLRPPASGITLRSLSHHLALERSEVETRWLIAPDPASKRVTDRLTMLLVPHPSVIRASDFIPVTGPLVHMDETRYGFYEYAPQERLDPEETVELAVAAGRHVGDIDLLVLPEACLDERDLPALHRTLVEAGIPYLITGVRQSASEGSAFGGNYAHFAAGDWQAPPQHKHHRWCLDASQVHQYHLGAALDPRRRWWEAICVPRRCLTFVTISEQLTICPLVCEDLARPDPVTDVIRSIAPTLVVALLLDGPQLATRWPARYASVLADDPGCSVLTLTALGMAQRSQPPGYAPSRVIALWKDAHRGLQQITLAENARAVALTAHPREVQIPTGDGRSGKPVSDLVLSGIEQIE